MTLPSETLPNFEAYYDSAKKIYCISDRQKNYIEVTDQSLRRHLRGAGYATETSRGEIISQVDRMLNDYQLDAAVQYAGPLAGHSRGLKESCGNKILVTNSPKLIEPQAGEFPVLAALMENLFREAEHDQRPYLYGWLKVMIEALRDGRHRPGQVIALAGPANCGKSLVQLLFTEAFGGRAAKPYRYMSGMTPFNAELFGAEHLVIEDEAASTDLRARRLFGARIKDFCVNEVQSCHAKNRQAISLRPVWRVSVSLNNEPENLMILPPMDESLKDKIMLLRANKAAMPMGTDSGDGRARFWAVLMAELPAFVHFLLANPIPEELRCERFGITTFQHPELLDAIEALSPEDRLLGLLDAVVFEQVTSAPIIVTSDEVERTLANSPFGYEARRLLNWANACGTYLGRLATKRPERVEQRRTNTARQWVIHPPVTP